MSNLANHFTLNSTKTSRFGQVERWPEYGLYLLVFYATARAVIAAFARPFWFDEIFTLIMARQSGLEKIWSALQRGVDRLVNDGYALRLVASEQDHFVFLVEHSETGSASTRAFDRPKG